jgi:hypothetical protein
MDDAGVGRSQCSYECYGPGDAGLLCTFECFGADQPELDQTCADAKVAACGSEQEPARPTDADVQKACADAETRCQKGLASAPSNADGCRIRRPSSTCTATVGELEACLNEQFDTLEKAVSAIPACSELRLADLRPSDAAIAFAPTDGAACRTFNEKCPGVVASDTSSSPAGG